MADVTNELMYELLKRVHGDIAEMKFDLQEIKRRMTGSEEALAGVVRSPTSPLRPGEQSPLQGAGLRPPPFSPFGRSKIDASLPSRSPSGT